MTSIQSPQLLADLYRDLRNRRLLPLVIVLTVGLAVVPIALSSSSEATPPVPAPTAPVASKSNAPTSQVVTSDPGVRDYKRRLPGEIGKDPFVQLFAPPVGAGATDSGLSTSTTPTTSSGAVSGTTGAGSAGTTVSGGGAGSTPSVPTGGADPIAGTETGNDKYLVFQLAVKSGASGEALKSRDHVEAFDSLPSKSVPALTYLGVSVDSGLNAKRAFFLVSNGVSEVSGDGKCIVGDPCQLLSLEPGQSLQLIWVDGVSYTLRLTGFNEVIRDKSPSGKSGSGKAGRGGSDDRSPRQLVVG